VVYSGGSAALLWVMYVLSSVINVCEVPTHDYGLVTVDVAAGCTSLPVLSLPVLSNLLPQIYTKLFSLRDMFAHTF